MIKSPANISIIVICAAPTFLMYFALNRVNRVPRRADIIPYIYPQKYLVSVPITKDRANTTIIPITTSYSNNFLLKKNGSIKAENSEEVERQTTATDTVETLIDSKKHNQCTVTSVPTANNPKKSFLFTEKSCLLINKKMAKAIKASPILYQTKGIVSIEMSFPKIPVRPNIITIRWTESSLCFFSI